MKINKKELILILSTKIWQYARRQKAWWKKDIRIKWHSPNDMIGIETEVKNFLK